MNKKTYIKGIMRNALCMALTLTAAGALTSCVGDDTPSCPAGGTSNTNAENAYFIQLNVNFPSEMGVRSETDGGTGESSDKVTATTNEAKIDNLHLYFFDAQSDKSGKLLLHFSTLKGLPSETTPVTLTQQVSVANLRQLLNKTVHVYALANLSSYPGVTEGTTTENSFLNDNTITISDLTTGWSQKFTTGGMVCPMANFDYFTLSLEGVGAGLGANPSDGAVITAFEDLFKGTYRENGEEKGRLWTLSASNLDLERMIARIDYMDGSNNSNVYKLEGHKSGITACDDSDGVYLKVNNISIFNVSPSAYLFRHTAAGDKNGASKTSNAYSVEAFGKEKDNTGYNGTSNTAYRWVADYNWGKTVTFLNAPTDATADGWTLSATNGKNTAEDIVKTKISGYDYSPWFYVMENTVPSVNDMTLANCTGLEFEVVLYDNTTRKPYEPTLTSGTAPDARITRNSDNYYQALKYNATGKYYYLTYKYLIPHNITDGTSSVDGKDGKFTGDYGPMQIGIVRNCVYQLSLKGITSLPMPGEPDNVSLTLNVRVKPWEYEGYTTEW